MNDWSTQLTSIVARCEIVAENEVEAVDLPGSIVVSEVEVNKCHLSCLMLT